MENDFPKFCVLNSEPTCRQTFCVKPRNHPKSLLPAACLWMSQVARKHLAAVTWCLFSRNGCRWLSKVELQATLNKFSVSLWTELMRTSSEALFGFSAFYNEIWVREKRTVIIIEVTWTSAVPAVRLWRRSCEYLTGCFVSSDKGPRDLVQKARWPNHRKSAKNGSSTKLLVFHIFQ